MVGDKLFVLAEPDEIAVPRQEQRPHLWSAFVNYYEAVTPDEKRRQSRSYAEVVDPLIAKLKQETDRGKRRALRARDPESTARDRLERFKIPADGHFESHFGIVGFTMPTPVSDGKHVYVWNGMGVAACFDLDGKRQWITRIKADELSYGSSPALADGVLVVFQHGLFGLDAKPASCCGQQKRIRNNVAALAGGDGRRKAGDRHAARRLDSPVRRRDSLSVPRTAHRPATPAGRRR